MRCAMFERLTIRPTTTRQPRWQLIITYQPVGSRWRVSQAIRVHRMSWGRWRILSCQTFITLHKRTMRSGKIKSTPPPSVTPQPPLHVFLTYLHSSRSSNASSSLNNVTSSIYATSNVNTNLVEQLNHHLTSSNNWRTVNSTNNSLSNLNLSNLNGGSNRIQSSTHSLILTPTITTTSSSLKRKSGAERLFAYFEADDSDDIELDYAR